MARTQEELNLISKNTLMWAISQLSEEEKNQIKEKCKAQAELYHKGLADKQAGRAKGAPSPFITNTSYFVKKDEQGKAVLTDKPFSIRAISSSRTAISTPVYHKTPRGVNVAFREFKGTVIQEDHKKAAEFIYSTVVTWQYANGKKVTPDNLSSVFGTGRFPPIEVNPRKDAQGNPAEGYWVNISLKVITDADPSRDFQNCRFSSRVAGKELSPATADVLLKPTETNKGYVDVVVDTHINDSEEPGISKRCEFRASRIVLIPNPNQNASMGIDDIYAAMDAMDGYTGTPAPASSSEPAMPQMTEFTDTMSPAEPSEADFMAMMDEISLNM